MAKYKSSLSVILLSAFALGSVSVVAQYQREMGAAREQVDSLGSQVTETDCGLIEYARVGEGYPVLVVHGALGGFDQGLLTASSIIDAGFQAIAISRFGYLRSPIPENANLDMQVDVYACLLDKLGIQQVAIWGVSAGATSAIRFVARYPERVSALILQVPAAPGNTLAAPPPKAAFTMMRSDFVYWAMTTYMRSFIQKMVGVPDGFVLTSETEAEITKLLATTLPSSKRIDGFTNDFQIHTDALYEEISETSPYSVYKIEAPGLVIMAADDPLALPENVRGLAEGFPNAHLHVVSDGGHPLLGHSEEVNAEIIQFLQDSVALPAVLIPK